MQIRIDGHDPPGRRFVTDGKVLGNVHVGVQVGKEPTGLVRGDTPAPTWTFEVKVVRGDDGGVDLRGPAVHGPRGQRFFYLTWGEVDARGGFAMFRRAKLMVADIDPALLAGADGGLVAAVALTDGRGGPMSGRVRPPAVRWS